MADQQKPVEVPETTPAVAEPVADAKPEEAPAADAPAADAAAPAADAAPEATEGEAAEGAAAPAEDAKKEEVKPIEAGTLEHKGAPANFPKNLIYSKLHFWFGTESVPKEKLVTYLKNEKTTEVAHHVAAWATETGKGLLFYGKESDKTTPTGAIQLAEASEPTTEGASKFSFTAKGHKHTFKAPTAAERDNWVEQLKLKIAEAKEIAATIAESETYKQTIESFKPTPPPKEDKPVAAAATEEGEAPKEEAKEEPKEDEAKPEEPKEEKKEGSKSRSASRKRASIFGSLLSKKEETKKEAPAEDKPAEDKPAETTEAPETVPEVSAEAEAEAPAADAAPAEEAKKDELTAKPTPSKRASIFGGLSFGKKKTETVESAPATPAKETSGADAAVAETAPVIPAVETTEPLSTEVSSPAAAAEGADAPATNGETKEVKTEKRKSSLPFGFGKKSAATSDEEGEKVKSPPFFSKLRQTVKGKGKAEKPAEDKPAEAAETSEATKEATPEEPAADEAAAPAEAPAAATPAPVTAAA
ncbi:Pleckstrin homology domain-containing protein [Rostrohypoxylon terebratum]|nr:Pleckstrin homology domain-containing protein [Rostrohypoxylon terebratum]